jgi:hypothetical protein
MRVRSRALLALVLLVAVTLALSAQPADVPFSFRSAGPESGLDAVTIFGGRQVNRYLLETTGSGVAMLDYANAIGRASCRGGVTTQVWSRGRGRQ